MHDANEENSSAAAAAPLPSKKRNSSERADMLAKRAAEQRSRVPRFTRVLGRKNLSKRGQYGQPWRTKKHTPSRRNDAYNAGWM